MYVLSCLLLCCIFEGSKNLHHAAIYISFYVVELAVRSEQKLYFCYDLGPSVYWVRV